MTCDTSLLTFATNNIMKLKETNKKNDNIDVVEYNVLSF